MSIAREGFPFIIIFSVLGIVFLLLPYNAAHVSGALFLIFGLFCLYFFRDPVRDIPVNAGTILAPGDGKVLEVLEEFYPVSGNKFKVIRIFLSIFNVHIQRSPVAGKIVEIAYHKGKFLDARNKRAAFENESNSIWIENETCRIMVKQIAGLIARRIVCRVKEGQPVSQGERLGIIRFGSQVDLFLPPDAKVLVKEGDKVFGGLTPVGLLNNICADSKDSQND